MNEECKLLHNGQNKLRSDMQEIRGAFQRVKNDNMARGQSNVAPSTANKSVLQDLAAIKITLDHLTLQLNSMVQRPEFNRLSSMVESLSKQPNTPPVDRSTPDSHEDQQVSSTEKWMGEVDRIDQMIEALDKARQSDHKSLASAVASFRSDVVSITKETTNIQDRLQEIVEDSTVKEQLTSDRFKSLHKSLSSAEAEVQTLHESLESKLFRDSQQPIPSVITHPVDNVASTSSQSEIRRNELDQLETEFHKTQQEVVMIQSDIQ